VNDSSCTNANTVRYHPALEACSIHDEAEAIPKRNHIIRAHKEFVAHRATCGKCNEIDIIP
jgi:hypothetical protein